MSREEKIQQHFINAVTAGNKINQELKDFYLESGHFPYRPEGITLDELQSLRWMYINCKGDLIDCWESEE